MYIKIDIIIIYLLEFFIVFMGFFLVNYVYDFDVWKIMKDLLNYEGFFVGYMYDYWIFMIYEW